MRAIDTNLCITAENFISILPTQWVVISTGAQRTEEACPERRPNGTPAFSPESVTTVRVPHLSHRESGREGKRRPTLSPAVTPRPTHTVAATAASTASTPPHALQPKSPDQAPAQTVLPQVSPTPAPPCRARGSRPETPASQPGACRRTLPARAASDQALRAQTRSASRSSHPAAPQPARSPALRSSGCNSSSPTRAPRVPAADASAPAQTAPHVQSPSLSHS